MSLIDQDKLLKDVSPESPCGEDLTYDAAWVNLQAMAQGTPERQIGESIIPAQEPNWKEVTPACVELFSRTHDLRVAMLLARGLLVQHGLPGLREGLALIRAMLEKQWDGFWPRLDPAEGNDPLERINIISALADAVFRLPIRQSPLCNSRQLGRFSIRDIAIAKGEIAVTPDPNKPAPAAMSVIEAAFSDTDTEELKAQAQAAKDSIADAQAIEALITDKVGADKAVSLEPLRDSLKEALACVEGFLVKRGSISEATGSAAAPAGATAAGAPAGAALSGDIRSTQDILTAIDKICQYYEKYEPSSPVPLMLRGAKRMVSKNFVEIMRQLPPDALRVIETLSGLTGEAPPSA
ncbi:MAG: type VI secretion system protein TssA [Phycisphaerae bacterium]